MEIILYTWSHKKQEYIRLLAPKSIGKLSARPDQKTDHEVLAVESIETVYFNANKISIYMTPRKGVRS
jgi:hypothetical protein